MSENRITIQFNGESREVPADWTLRDILVNAQIELRFVAVEVNLELVPREEHEQTRLRSGDRLEVVTLVGGG